MSATYPWGLQSASFVARAARAIGARPQAITGAQRSTSLVHARWAVMLALRGHGWSYPRIGHAIGDRDHSTIMHGVERASALRLINTDFAALCAKVAA